MEERRNYRMEEEKKKKRADTIFEKQLLFPYFGKYEICFYIN